MNTFIIQFIGILAWIIVTFSYWQKKKINIVIMQLIAYILYSIHFWLLDGVAGAICNLAGIVVLFLLIIKEKTNKNCYWLIALIILIYMPIAIYSYEGIYTLLPVFASILPLSSNWFKNTLIIRIGGILGSVCWFIYAIFVGSYATIITETLFTISTIFSIYKNNKKQENKNNII